MRLKKEKEGRKEVNINVHRPVKIVEKAESKYKAQNIFHVSFPQVVKFYIYELEINWNYIYSI